MRRVGITQRVETVESYGERRDCLDQRWAELLAGLGCLPVPVPNRVDARAFVEQLNLEALLFTGGNDLGAAPERDGTEAALLDEGCRRSLPIVGVCRGLQLVNSHFGGSLRKVAGHVATRHPLSSERAIFSIEVNSYHGYALDRLAPTLEALAWAPDGTVEAAVHREHPIVAVMWHPEREEQPELEWLRRGLEGKLR
ncbi:MAG: type 1 glutamine amidotransferase [Armatimonadetes bacterium]|nr:type 1 glutamine amidotransferase [Armatimonadota bacterium]